jgi:hypothetical protein
LQPVSGPGNGGDETAGGHPIPIADPRVAQRTRLLLRLQHPPELAGYFALSLLPRRADDVAAAALEPVGE